MSIFPIGNNIFMKFFFPTCFSVFVRFLFGNFTSPSRSLMKNCCRDPTTFSACSFYLCSSHFCFWPFRVRAAKLQFVLHIRLEDLHLLDSLLGARMKQHQSNSDARF